MQNHRLFGERCELSICAFHYINRYFFYESRGIWEQDAENDYQEAAGAGSDPTLSPLHAHTKHIVRKKIVRKKRKIVRKKKKNRQKKEENSSEKRPFEHKQLAGAS